MKPDNAAVLIQSLIERVRTESGAITVEISLSEKQALEWVVRFLRDGPGPSAPEQSFPLNLASTQIDTAQDPDILLCLDFGTAASKACARRLASDELVPLAIGQQAGQTEPVFALTSSVFIGDDGRLYFGQQAERMSHQPSASVRRRIDSVKDILAKADPRFEFGARALSSEENPTSIALQELDALELYLAYFTDTATSSLEKTAKVSRYVRRRFSLPAFKPEYAQWATEHLRRLIARAQILADTFSGRWHDGIPVATANAALKAARAVPPPLGLVEPEGVTEPRAAIASRTIRPAASAHARELFAIVDIGAGTTDYALFCRAPKAAVDDAGDRFWVIPETQKVLRQAGNQVDHELKRFILEKAGIRESDGDFAQIDASLSLDVRALKEALFRGEGVESYMILQKDKPVQIYREEFLASDGMRKLERQIHATFEEMVRSAPASWIIGQQFPRIVLLVTGGGAELQIVRSLDATTVNVGRTLTVQLGTALPPYIDRDYPQLRNEYLRLAVALGGSAKDLPEVSAKFHDLGASFDKYVPDVVRKGQ